MHPELRIIAYLSKVKIRKLFSRSHLPSLPYAIVLAEVVTYSLIFTIYTTEKYEFFRTGYFDFGNALQEIWLAAHGQFLSVTLGRPILAITALVFLIYPYPETVLAFESFMLGIGAIPIYLIARKLLHQDWIALIISTTYLISPSLWGVNAYEYHDLSLAIPFLLFAAFSYLDQRLVPYLVSLLLALTTSSAIVVLGLFLALSFGLDYIIDRNKSALKFLKATLICVLVWSVYLQLTPFLPQAHLSTISYSGYTLTGSTGFLNPSAVLSSPLDSVARWWSQKFQYLVYILAPVIFLPFLSLRRLLPTVPWLGIVVFYDYRLAANGAVGQVFTIWSQWSTYLIPFVFVSAIYGLRTATESSGEVQNILRKRLVGTMLIVSILMALTTGVFSPFSPPVNLSTGDSTVPTTFNATLPYHGVWPTPVSDYAVLNGFVNAIPQNASILTQNAIGSKLWARSAPVTIFDQPGYRNENADIILIDYNLTGVCQTCLNSILASGQYKLVSSYVQGGIYEYAWTLAYPLAISDQMQIITAGD